MLAQARLKGDYIVSGLSGEMTLWEKKSRAAPLRSPSLILFSILLDKMRSGKVREETEEWSGGHERLSYFFCV